MQLILAEDVPVKLLITTILALFVFLPTSVGAVSDADVTLIKTSKVVIEEDTITIVAEAKTSITLIQGDDTVEDRGERWRNRPVAHVQVKSDQAAFVIKRPREAVLAEAWQMSLRAAKDLQAGKDVGRIGYHAPDISIKGNLIDSVTGYGFLYEKGE